MSRDLGLRRYGTASTFIGMDGTVRAVRSIPRFVRGPAGFPVRFLLYSLVLFFLVEGPLRNVLRDPLCRAVASHSALALGALGESVTCSGTVVSAPEREHSFQVIYACTAMPATILLVSAVLAFPVSLARRAIGVLAGTAAIYLVNLARLVILFYCYLYLPDWYDRLHYTVWQSLLVVIALLLFLAWASLAMPRGARRELGEASPEESA